MDGAARYRNAPQHRLSLGGHPLSVIAALRHVTKYRYDQPAELGPQVIRLRPAPHCRTRIPSYSLKVTPANHFLNWQQDPHGNWLARLVFPERTTELTITVDLTADMAVINPFDFFVEPYAEKLPLAYAEDLAADLAPYRQVEDDGPLLQKAFEALRPDGRGTVEFLVELNAGIQRDVRYLVRMEPGVQTPDETLSLGSGSCRDSAWLLVQLVRKLGLAARFVSGYLIQIKADIDPVHGPRGTDSDFTDLHAWAEVCIPGAGWVGLDATSGLLCGEGHLPLAAAPHHRSCAPISGVASAVATEFDFEMEVTRLADDIRITRPFEDADWQALDALGERVEADLQAGDVRLTLGGEPTFVSAEDFQAAEWNTDASGPTKPAMADELIQRLKARFGPGGLLHFGQGKWYPGEPLPRWAFGLYWRRDGLPVWRGLARPASVDRRAPTGADAAALLERLADRLGVDANNILGAHEDPLHWIKIESDLPAGVTLDDIDQEGDRVRLRRALEGGLSKALGFVLPLRRAQFKGEGDGWLSEAWRFRRGRMHLLAGTSPIGLRLPLARLPDVDPDDFPYITPLDPYEDRAQLPSFDDLYRASARGPATPTPPGAKAPAVRTAVCAEPRDGVVYIFMPPLARLEDYLALTAHIEAAAGDLPIRIEGYPPPDDVRMALLKVTPDPGVIEVNVQPSANWREAVAITTGVYEDARATRLGADKFMIDGRHTGTGGGAHVVLGGASPADSPFLRRLDLLKSLLLCWQRHPSLSYFFSGLFIGPTSQAPSGR